MQAALLPRPNACFWCGRHHSREAPNSHVIPSEPGSRPRLGADLSIAEHVTQVGEVLRSEPDWHSAQDDKPLNAKLPTNKIRSAYRVVYTLDISLNPQL
jgi:hypothetical protein